MKSWHFLGCLLPALMLAGCAPPMPHLAKPTPLQDLQLGSDLTQKKSSVAAVADWWRPLLNQPEQNIMQLALEKNPDMLAAKARIALALSALREAGAQREPQLQGTGQIGVSRWTKNQFYLPPYAGETSWNNLLKFDFSFHLDLWGKEQEQVKEARLRLQAAEQQRRAARLILENAVLQQLLA
ncbi:TolC family protein, partial [Acidithiobacillus albertensis]|uniref:TolC family protein n=1 Tax=Acidithiobacillus albertensis TaxID=119978 RepID=UPI0013018B9D